MDLEAVRMFVRVAEQASFTRAAEQLGMTKSRVSLRVKELEAELGSALLHRTTRAVRLTPDGEQFLARARAFVDEADELATLFQATSTLRGVVRVDLPIAFARGIIIPALPDFLAQHPQLELIVSTTDRRVDVIRDGFDCVLRIGSLVESGLVAKRIGVLPMVNCVSASYARRHGVPRTLADLERHQLVGYSLALGGEEATFEYREGARWVTRPMRSVVTVNNTDSYQAACRAGLGIIQAPRYGMADDLRRGVLVEVLPEHTCEPMPVSLVHAHGRNVPKRVRAVMAFVTGAMEDAFAAA